MSAFRVKAPLRLSFAGGGTDIPPFSTDEGGAVLSCTIDRFAYGSLVPRTDSQVRLESVDLDLSCTADLRDLNSLDERLDLVRAVMSHFVPYQETGYDLLLKSDAAPGTGLGSSSALVVALVGLLARHSGMSLTNYEVAELAHQIERNDFGIAGGQQDQYAAAFGGFNFMEFDSRTLVSPLRIPPDITDELQMSLVLVDTGRSRHSGKVLSSQIARMQALDAEVVQSLRAQKALAHVLKGSLLRGELHEFGVLLDMAWNQKKRLSPLVSNERIDAIYDHAKAAGALGGKVTGAGGGGHLMLFCDFACRHRVEVAVKESGATVVEFSFVQEGMKLWQA